MMTQRRTIIPIFDYKLVIIIFDDWDEVKKIFDDGPAPRGIVKLGYGGAIIGIKSNMEGSIVHEAEHIKNAIWDFIGYIPQKDNDEVDAYLITYIYKKIYDVFIKHNEQYNK